MALSKSVIFSLEVDTEKNGVERELGNLVGNWAENWVEHCADNYEQELTVKIWSVLLLTVLTP